MATYRGAAGRGFKIIDGKRYTLWGWLTSGDKQALRAARAGKNERFSRLLRENHVRVLGARAPFAVWARAK